MAIRLAYGKREKIQDAIESGRIPKGTLIVTEDNIDSELVFYDTEGKLLTVSEKKKFNTISEAESYLSKYDLIGSVVTIHNGTEWIPYIVSDDNILTPISQPNIILDVFSIDGGIGTE